MIPQPPHARRYFAQPKTLHVGARANVKAWLVGRGSIFVIMRTYHKGYENHPNTQVMFFRRFGSCPQVLARWSGPEKAKFLEDTKATFEQCNATDFPWPELGPPVILSYDQLMKVYGRWMQPLRKKDGKRSTKAPYVKKKRVVVMRNDSVNLSTLYPGCEVAKVEVVHIECHTGGVDINTQNIKLNLNKHKLYKARGMEYYCTVNNSATRFRQTLGQWRVSFSSEDQNIKSFTAMVTIKKEASDGNV